MAGGTYIASADKCLLNAGEVDRGNDTRLQVRIMSYNGGPPKTRITHVFTTNAGEERASAKTGGFSADELLSLVPLFKACLEWYKNQARGEEKKGKSKTVAVEV